MLLNRSDFAEFTKKRDQLLKLNELAEDGVVSGWKAAWQNGLAGLPYLAKVASVPPTGRRQQIAMLCTSRFVGLNLSIAQSDMERVFAQKAQNSIDACYCIVQQPRKVELHFVELTRSRQVVSGVVVIAAAA